VGTSKLNLVPNSSNVQITHRGLRQMRNQIISALLAHAQGDIQKHKMNVEVYLSNPVGIGEHPDVMEAIEQELNMIAKYEDQVSVIKKHFLIKD
jgi:hypothetical protein|tara:strand:- start:1797 stop:2078 length:282 start_codon:yes stop_codon:yes gene_type:complete